MLGPVRGLLVMALVWLAASGVEAQSREYRRKIAQAVSEFDAGNWAEARALFTQAHALDPNARTLRGMGMCAFEMRAYAEAIETLEASLAERRRPLTRRQRRSVEALLARARSFIGVYRVHVERADATLTVDDAAPTLEADGSIVLPLGEHVFEARRDGYLTERRRVEVRGGEQLEVSLALQPEPPPVVTTVGSSIPDGALALLLAGGGALLAEAGLIGWLVDRQGELDTCLGPPEGFVCDNPGPLEAQRDAALGISIGGGVVAIGLATVGIIWWLQ